MKGNTDVDNVAKVAVITKPQVTATYFPSLDKASAEKMEQLFETFVPSTFSVSLHSLLASTPKKEAAADAQRPQPVTQRSFPVLSRKEVTSITFHERKLTTIRKNVKEQA
jgi:hypothetical protein